MRRSPGTLVVSLDFELYWGFHDHTPMGPLRDRLTVTRRAVEAMLELFARYEIHATWATVGILFHHSREDVFANLPAVLPKYRDPRLSPYDDMEGLGNSETEDPLRLAPSLVRKIAATPHQELGSHTFSHFICLAPGQSMEAFEADLEAAQRSAARYGVTLRSLVFPRNQYGAAHLDVLARRGFRVFRGNPGGWAYALHDERRDTPARRLVRLVDTYVNVTGHHVAFPKLDRGVLNVPASRYLRAYSPKFAALESLRIKRVVDGMKAAARTGGVFHMWWHPNNLGYHLEPNLRGLERIFEAYSEMNARGTLRSFNMGELWTDEARG